MDTASSSTISSTTASSSKAQRLIGYVKGLGLSWPTVWVMATFFAFADGFIILAYQGAVGAIERQSEPFQRWIVESILMIPLFAAAVVVAMILTRFPETIHQKDPPDIVRLGIIHVPEGRHQASQSFLGAKQAQ